MAEQRFTIGKYSIIKTRFPGRRWWFEVTDTRLTGKDSKIFFPACEGLISPESSPLWVADVWEQRITDPASAASIRFQRVGGQVISNDNARKKRLGMVAQ